MGSQRGGFGPPTLDLQSLPLDPCSTKVAKPLDPSLLYFPSLLPASTPGRRNGGRADPPPHPPKAGFGAAPSSSPDVAAPSRWSSFTRQPARSGPEADAWAGSGGGLARPRACPCRPRPGNDSEIWLLDGSCSRPGRLPLRVIDVWPGVSGGLLGVAVGRRRWI